MIDRINSLELDSIHLVLGEDNTRGIHTDRYVRRRRRIFRRPPIFSGPSHDRFLDGRRLARHASARTPSQSNSHASLEKR